MAMTSFPVTIAVPSAATPTAAQYGGRTYDHWKVPHLASSSTSMKVE